APVQDRADTVREVAHDQAPQKAEARREFEQATVPAAVRGHAWALRELTRNLLHNALKHSPPGGALAVRLAPHEGQAVLTVADSGPGITEALRPRLMQPFTSAGSPGGAGLGLAICREIVQSLGGSLSLDNRASDGRVTGLDATVRLPLVSPLLTPLASPLVPPRAVADNPPP
ncbi:MAG: sensor histidine kinase, partial [Aquabacterium sp.]|nr:sensor histidine kinase [Aquabacterium sp.]